MHELNSSRDNKTWFVSDYLLENIFPQEDIPGKNLSGKSFSQNFLLKTIFQEEFWEIFSKKYFLEKIPIIFRCFAITKNGEKMSILEKIYPF